MYQLKDYDLKKGSKTKIPEFFTEDKDDKRTSEDIQAPIAQIDKAVQFDYGRYAKTSVKKRVTRYVQKRD